MQKHFWFVPNFAINGKYSENIYDNQIIMLPLWSSKHTKMQFQGVSIYLGGSFDSNFTHQCKFALTFQESIIIHDS